MRRRGKWNQAVDLVPARTTVSQNTRRSRRQSLKSYSGNLPLIGLFQSMAEFAAAVDLDIIATIRKRPRITGPFAKEVNPSFYAACAVSACWLTSDSASWLNVLSVFFSSLRVASSSFTASL